MWLKELILYYPAWPPVIIGTRRAKNKPKNMKTMTQPSGQKNIIKPFKYKWENKIPTTVMLFDEVRFGASYEEVDINNNNPVD